METKPKTQSTAIQPARPSALSAMAKRLNVEPEKLLGTLQATCFKGSTPEQMLALVVVSNEYALNPFLKEIYAFPAKGGGIVPVISIDGWIKMINRAPGFDGLEFEFESDANSDGPGGGLISCTCTLFLRERSRPVKVTEYFDECYRKTEPWEMMPRRMLRHKALIQAARIAFGFSGVHDEDEAIDISATVEDVTAPRNARQLRGAPAGAGDTDQVPDAGVPPKTPQGGAATVTARAEFAKLMEENEIDFSTVQRWGDSTGNIPDVSSMASLDEVPEETLKRLLRAKAGLISGLKQAKGN